MGNKNRNPPGNNKKKIKKWLDSKGCSDKKIKIAHPGGHEGRKEE